MKTSFSAARRLRWLACGAWFLGAIAVPAQADTVRLQAQVLHATEVASAQGVPTGGPRRVSPGGEVVYEVRYAHNGAEPARMIITNPWPRELLFVPDSSTAAGTQFQVSVDGGKTFGPLAALRVVMAGGLVREAIASDVTHVRWVFDEPVVPGAKGVVSLRAQVR